jgi:hypothetical protein
MGFLVVFGYFLNGRNPSEIGPRQEKRSKEELPIKIRLFIQFLMPETPKTVKILDSNVYI